MSKDEQVDLQNMDPRQIEYVYRILTEQLSVYESQLDLLQGNFSGINITLDTLKGLDENPEKKEQEVIVPLGPNAYTMAKIMDSNKVLLYLKNDVVIEKKLTEGINTLEEMAKNNQDIQEKLRSRMGEINSQIAQIQQVARNFQK